MKRLLGLIVLLVALALVLTWPFISARLTEDDKKPQVPKAKPINNSGIRAMAADPKGFVGKKVNLNGLVAQEPEFDAQGTHFHVSLRYGLREEYMVVDDPAMVELSAGDAINVRGKIDDTFVGVTNEGQESTVVRVTASSIKPIALEEAAAPAEVIWKTGSQKEDHDVVIRVGHVEFAAIETRFYLSIDNQSPGPIVVHVFNSTLSQNGKMVELKMEKSADYQEIPVDIEPGTKSDGVMVFPTMDSNKPINLMLKISGSNWESEVELPLDGSADRLLSE